MVSTQQADAKLWHGGETTSKTWRLLSLSHFLTKTLCRPWCHPNPFRFPDRAARLSAAATRPWSLLRAPTCNLLAKMYNQDPANGSQMGLDILLSKENHYLFFCISRGKTHQIENKSSNSVVEINGSIAGWKELKFDRTQMVRNRNVTAGLQPLSLLKPALTVALFWFYTLHEPYICTVQ